MFNSFDDHARRRLAHDRERLRSRARIASVPGAHAALYTSLRTGILGVGDRLDESRLVPMFAFSRNAVRDALRLLADEGIVTRQPRNGTVVVSRSADVPLGIALGWGENVDPQHALVVTDRRWTPSTPATRLHLQTPQDRVHVTEVIDSHNDRPSMLHTRFTIDGAERPLVASPASTSDFRLLFERTYGCELAAINCWVEAVGADKPTAARLGVAPGTVLLVKSRVLQGPDGIPREYSISHYLAAEVSFSANVDTGRLAPVSRAGADTVGAPAARTAGVDGVPRRRENCSADLHTQLRALIRTGVLRVGDRLSEMEIAENFAASRSSVRLAMSQLAAEGVLSRTRSHGTVVTSTVSEYTLNAGMVYPPAEFLRYGDEELASQVILTPPFIAELLQTESESIRLDEYLISRDGEPTTVYIRYTAAEAERRPLTCTHGDDFEALFARAYGAPPGRIAHSLHAIRADRQIARRLAVPPATIVLLSERLIHDRLGQPRELSHSYHLAAKVGLTSRHELHAEPVGIPRP